MLELENSFLYEGVFLSSSCTSEENHREIRYEKFWMIETMLRVQLNCICMMLLAVSYVATLWKPLIETSGKSLPLKLYHRFTLTLMLLLATDTIGWLLDGRNGTAAHIALWISHTLYYMVHALPIIYYILYADIQMNRNPERTRTFGKPLYACWGVIAAAALASPFTGWFFHIDQANVYTRGNHFNIFAATQFALVGLSFIPVLAGKRKPKPRIFSTLLFFPLLASLSAILQYLYYGLSAIWPVTTVFLVAAALNIQRTQIGIDHLTGISNRLSFYEALEQSISSAGPNKKFGCILLDLDGFKTINDTLGHETGDQALEDSADILRQTAGHDGMVARYGGDEFALLVANTNEQKLKKFVKTIEEAIERFNRIVERPYTLSASIGYGLYQLGKYKDSADFMSSIDAAMYTHKRSKQKEIL